MSRFADSTVVDPADPNLVQGGLPGFALLRPFNQARLLAAADIHVAIRLCRLAGTTDEGVALAVALAVRAPRVGHVSVDLADIRASAVEAGEEVDLDLLPWPEPGTWIERVAGSDLVDVETGDTDTGRPLKLVGTGLYLERYWRDEVDVAAEILSRLPTESGSVPPSTDESLGRLFPGSGARDQLTAARSVLSRTFSVIAGGPGTGKTTTVARLLAVLFEQAAAEGGRLPLVGLAAPTGKAAARMEEAVRAEAARMDITPEIRAALAEVSGSTLHRLLGTRFDRPGRFRHHGGHRLPHDMVVVDEASMVSLSMMASLAQAVRPDARLVLVGDPEQLVSVEAGAVLADIVGSTGGGPSGPPQPQSGGGPSGPPRPQSVGGDARAADPAEAPGAAPVPAIARSICVLRQNHRFAGSLARLATAVRAGDDQLVMDLLSTGEPTLSWVDADPGEFLVRGVGGFLPVGLEEIRASTTGWAAAVHESAAEGDVAGAIAALRRHRVLCAHRRGAAGVRAWTRVIQDWVAGTDPTPGGDDTWYAGRPVMVTVNDYALRLFNGDAGVAVAVQDEGGAPVGGAPLGTAPVGGAGFGGAAGQVGSGAGRGGARRLAVAFDEGADRPARMVSPTRLNAVETVYAMTVHKSQGSEFDRVTLLLPPATSRLLTRELLYTAITRARSAVTVVGTADALRTSVRTPIARASGLGERLWGDGVS